MPFLSLRLSVRLSYCVETVGSSIFTIMAWASFQFLNLTAITKLTRNYNSSAWVLTIHLPAHTQISWPPTYTSTRFDKQQPNFGWWSNEMIGNFYRVDHAPGMAKKYLWHECRRAICLRYIVYLLVYFIALLIICINVWVNVLPFLA